MFPIRPSVKTPPPRDPVMALAKRWTLWRAKPNPDPGKKPLKVPSAKPTDPNTWKTYTDVIGAVSDVVGVGFEMYGTPGVVGIDIDNCYDNGEFSPIASKILGLLKTGSYHVELSPSGRGVRVYAAASKLPFADYLNRGAGLEVYSGTTGRYLTYTGHVLPGFGDGPFSPLSQQAIDLLASYSTQTAVTAPASPASSVNLPDLDAREDWAQVYPLTSKLPKKHREFLTSGDLATGYASASEQLFAVVTSLLRHYSPAHTYQVLISAHGSWNVALSHRGEGAEKAKVFIWSDIQRAKSLLESKDQAKAQEAEASSLWKLCKIEVEINEKGIPRALPYQLNAMHAFMYHPDRQSLRYNVFDGRVMEDGKDLDSQRMIELSAWVCRFLGWNSEPRLGLVEEAVIAAAKTRPCNPIADELNAYQWDRVERIRDFTIAITGDANPLDVELLRRWLVGFVARGITPGCQMDTVLCLSEDEGGGFKTTFTRVLAGGPDRVSDTPGFGGDKDSSMLRGGMRIVELGEGIAARRGDTQQLKLDVTKLFDHFRPPWGRVTEKRARGFVYVLTSNDASFLRSEQDGLRRIWPIECQSEIDIDWIRENRDQLLAEAVLLFDLGYRWWFAKGEEPAELKARQEAAVSEGALDSYVAGLVGHPDLVSAGNVTLADIKRILESSNARAGAEALDSSLKKFGFRSVSTGRFSARRWYHPSWPKAGGNVISMRKGRTDDPRPGSSEGANYSLPE